MNSIADEKVKARGINRALSCSLALIFMPLAAGKPLPKPPAVKKLTTDDLLKLSVIENYTDTEDALLETLRGKPDRVLVQLIKMHQRRLDQARADEPRLLDIAISGGHSNFPTNSEAYENCKAAIPIYVEAIKRLKATKL